MSKYLLRSIVDSKAKSAISVASSSTLDKDYIIAGFKDKTVRFFDSETGAELKKCRGYHAKAITCVAISLMGPQGEDPVIASGCRDGSVVIWNSTTFDVIKTLVFPVAEVRCMTIYQGNQTYLVLGTRDSLVIVWDLTNNCQVALLKGHKGCVHCVAFLSYFPDVNDMNTIAFCLASGGADRTVRLWDLFASKRRKKLRHGRSVTSIAIASKGIQPILASAGAEKIIRLWDVETGILLLTLEGHLGTINSLAIWEGFELLVISASADKTLRVFDILTGECVCVLMAHEDEVYNTTVALAGKTRIIVSCSNDRTLRFWNLDDIIETYFRSESGIPGQRNDNEAYLPEVLYEPPPAPEESEAVKQRRLQREEAKKKQMQDRVQSRKGSAENAIDAPNADAASEVHTPTKTAVQDEKDDKADYKDGEDDEAQSTGEELRGAGSTDRGSSSGSLLNPFSPSNTAKVMPFAGDDVSVKKSSMTFRMMSSIATILTGHKKSKVAVPPAEDTCAVSDKDKDKVSHHAADKNSLASLVTSQDQDQDQDDASQGESRVSSMDKQNTVLSLDTSRAGSNTAPALTARQAALLSPQHVQTDRSKAGAVLDKYSMATVQHELDHDRQKSKASEKLQQRLSSRKTGIVLTSSSSTKNPMESLELIKAEKLKEHEKQEGRMKQAMAMAQQRSAFALQKRLEEAKQKKLLSKQPVSDDDDSDEEDEGTNNAESSKYNDGKSPNRGQRPSQYSQKKRDEPKELFDFSDED